MFYQVANYITKLRGLKPLLKKAAGRQPRSCKLYHKTTWFETEMSGEIQIILRAVANYITKLRGLKPYSLIVILPWIWLQIISQNYVVWNQTLEKYDEGIINSCKLYHKTTWFETRGVRGVALWRFDVANYITKLRGLKHLGYLRYCS